MSTTVSSNKSAWEQFLRIYMTTYLLKFQNDLIVIWFNSNTTNINLTKCSSIILCLKIVNFILGTDRNRFLTNSTVKYVMLKQLRVTANNTNIIFCEHFYMFVLVIKLIELMLSKWFARLFL